jgi:hypothetical protein
VDFSRYATSCFNPFLFRAANHAVVGCGASALGLLTGIPPAKFAAKNQDHYPDEFMLRCLRRHGFRVLRLTQCNLSQNTSGVNSRHVLLLSQLFQENEATWIVLFNGVCYHNFDVYSLEALSFINKPLLSAYVVFHPTWQEPASTPVKLLPTPRTSSGGVSWLFLRKSGLGSRSTGVERVSPQNP